MGRRVLKIERFESIIPMAIVVVILLVSMFKVRLPCHGGSLRIKQYVAIIYVHINLFSISSSGLWEGVTRQDIKSKIRMFCAQQD
tara:strand:- start:73 stop:327 length:255 start_codon:yes stop_codon:yes gene_type:complete